MHIHYQFEVNPIIEVMHVYRMLFLIISIRKRWFKIIWSFIFQVRL